MTATLAGLALVVAVVATLVQRWPVAVAGAALVGAAAVSHGGLDRGATGDGVYAMAYVAGMVFVAAAAEHSGLLAAAANVAIRPLRRPAPLLAATFLGACVVTTLLNLDTTAVLFTPLALSLAAEAERPPMPFAVAALLGANFGSMLLPSSNLTNLVLWRHSHTSYAEFLRELAVVAIVATALTLVVLVAALGRNLPRRPDRPGGPPGRVTDPPLALASGLAIVGLTVGFVAGLPVAPAALVVGVALVLVRRRLWADRLPVVLIVAVVSLFAAAGLLRDALDVAAHLRAVSPLGLAALGAGIAAVGSNLAAVLLLETAATNLPLTKGLLIGVNLGVGLTPVASLATILWRDTLRARNVAVPWRAYFALAIPLSIAFVLLTPLLT